jgi:O-acetyl-ADP-ribose deacetylase (regulator of RNase III)
MIEIIFCDIKKKFISAINRRFNEYELINKNKQFSKYFKFRVLLGDVRNIKLKNVAYISPANSFVTMCGGIDLIYKRDMFPDIDKIIQEKIKKLQTTTILKKKFGIYLKNEEVTILPVGDAIITPLCKYHQYETCYIVTAPTMSRPMNIRNSNNPYRAFLAALKVIDNYKEKIDYIVCPGLGTGKGKISADESAKQIFKAITHFIQQNKQN